MLCWLKDSLVPLKYLTYPGFRHSSVGEESTCIAGDPSSIPGVGRSPGEGIGYPLQYSWATLVAQLAKNLPAMQETWVWYLCWEDSPGERKGYPLQYSGLENTRVSKSLSDFRFHFACPRKSKGMCRNSALYFHKLFPSVLISSGILNL